jgi:dihydroorotase
VKTLLLKGGRVVDPASELDAVRDVLIEEGTIAKVGSGLTGSSADTVDLTGKVVCPGFIDAHVHLREPGQEHKETIASGTRAAAAGGFTAVAAMPNTDPVNDNQSVTEFVVATAAREGVVRVWPIGAITKGLRGEELAEIGDMVEAGAVAVSDDGMGVESGRVMRRALEYARLFEIPVIGHEEDLALAEDGVMHEGKVSTLLGLRGKPAVAEEAMIARDLLLAEDARSRFHVAHLSTARGLELVRRGRQRGVPVTCEVAPHHLTLTDEAVRGFDTNFKMNPPLRTEDDRAALIEGLRDGTVDAVATDHAPHHPDEKAVEFSRAPNGVVGLETAVSVMLDRLVAPGHLDLGRMVELLSPGPARVLGVPGGSLREGGPADITVLDLERTWTVDPAAFRSLARNTPWVGESLTGTPVMTVVGGAVVHSIL